MCSFCRGKGVHRLVSSSLPSGDIQLTQGPPNSSPVSDTPLGARGKRPIPSTRTLGFAGITQSTARAQSGLLRIVLNSLSPSPSRPLPSLLALGRPLRSVIPLDFLMTLPQHHPNHPLHLLSTLLRFHLLHLPQCVAVGANRGSPPKTFYSQMGRRRSNLRTAYGLTNGTKGINGTMSEIHSMSLAEEAMVGKDVPSVIMISVPAYTGPSNAMPRP